MASDDAIPADGQSTTTKYKAVGFRVVNNVTQLAAQKTKIISSTFTCADDPLQTSFKMILDFGTTGENKLKVAVQNTSRDVKLVQPFITFYIYDDKMVNLKTRHGDFTSGASRVRSPGFTWTFSDFPLNKEVVRIMCDVHYAHEIPDIVRPGSAENDLSESLSLLLEYPEDHDFTLCVEDEQLHCHKVVLIARSSFFRGLFQSGMRESQTNSVAMDDASPAIYRNLLQFLYSGRLPSNMTEIAFDLLPLADKYALDELKAACEDIVRSLLTVDNVIQTIILADLHHCPDLFRFCLSLFKENMDELKTKEEWRSLRQLPDLLERLLLSCNKEESSRVNKDSPSCVRLGHSMQLGSDLARMVDVDNNDQVTVPRTRSDK